MQRGRMRQMNQQNKIANVKIRRLQLMFSVYMLKGSTMFFSYCINNCRGWRKLSPIASISAFSSSPSSFLFSNDQTMVLPGA